MFVEIPEIRIPKISAKALDHALVSSATANLITTNNAGFSSYGALKKLLLEPSSPEVDIEKLDFLLEVTEGKAASLFSNDDRFSPFTFVRFAFEEGKESHLILNELIQKYPIFGFFDDQGEVIASKIDDLSIKRASSLYPLFSKPNSSTIGYFIGSGWSDNVAFFEIEGSYFIGILEENDSLLDLLALGYLLVDGDVPANIKSLSSSDARSPEAEYKKSLRNAEIDNVKRRLRDGSRV